MQADPPETDNIADLVRRWDEGEDLTIEDTDALTAWAVATTEGRGTWAAVAEVLEGEHGLDREAAKGLAYALRMVVHSKVLAS